MTSTVNDVAEHVTARAADRTPSYGGPGPYEILRRLRALQLFCDLASSAISAQDVARAQVDAARALVELTAIVDALREATPATILDEQASERRRISAEWQPDMTREDAPLVDLAQADPVWVSANDLVDLLRAASNATVGGPFPDGVGRAAVHIARQQPHRLVDFWSAAGHRWQQVRAAVLQADALPPAAEGEST